MSSIASKSRHNEVYTESSINASSKDFYKQGKMAKTMAKFAVCPIFPSMFSDLQNYPRKQYVIRRTTPVPEYMDNMQDSNSSSSSSRQQVVGTDRYKYFHNSTAGSHANTNDVPKLDLTCFYDLDDLKNVHKQRIKYKTTGKRNAKIQTIYRETSVQTMPWEPNYTVIKGDPELLMLDFLKWGQNLPAGTAEVDMIHRIRSKRNLDHAFPEGMSDSNFAQKRQMIEEYNRTEWAKREKDMDEIQAMRLELLEKMLNELLLKSKCRNEKKLRMFIDMKLVEKKEKILKLQKDAEREKRRLKSNFTGILTRYGKVNVFDEHADFKSELYCPLMRHGTNPKYRHNVLYPLTKKYKAQFYSVENYNTLPKHLKEATEFSEAKLPGRRLCLKETKWTLPVLKQLYLELKELRGQEVRYPNLRVCVQVHTSLPPTPELQEPISVTAPIDEAAILLQKILRGRSVQAKIYSGRARCKELIEDLRGSTALLKGDECKKAKLRDKRKEEQLNATSYISNMKALEGSLKKLSGSVAGTLLDFLNKDLMRLHRERRAHAMILLVERMRQLREAEEAGRRQKEIRRRLEHDEMFRQVVKVHQDTVDLYLQDIITEGMEFSSEAKANDYVEKLTAKVKDEEDEIESAELQMDREEYISNLVHNFVIPEVEKNLVRGKLKKQQKKYLKTAHDVIYNKISSLPKGLETPTSIRSMETTSDSQLVLDEEALQKTLASERQTVIEDVRSILDELITIPYKMSAIENLVPCSASSEVQPFDKLDEESEFKYDEIAEEEQDEDEEEEETKAEDKIEEINEDIELMGEEEILDEQE